MGRYGDITDDYLGHTTQWTAADPYGQPPPPPEPERPRRSPVTSATVRGWARGVDLRPVQVGQGPTARQLQVLTFRVERYGAGGERLHPVPVELRAAEVRGRITDNDEVEVSGRWRGGVLRAGRIRNHTTRSAVRRGRRAPLRVVAALLALALLAGGVMAATRFVPQVTELVPVGTRVVPDVVGLQAGQAGMDIAQAGLNPRTVTQKVSDPDRYGYVLRTDPPAGTELSAGSTVTMVLAWSTGDAPRQVPG